MNTREREVMDARFEAWWHRQMPNLVSGCESDDRAICKAAWTAALLAEGSASSEGAEAVGRVDVAKLYSLLLSIGTFADLKGINFEGRPISDAVAEAIGELSTCPQPAQGEPANGRDARIDAALAVIRQDYSRESVSSNCPSEYVKNAVHQLIDAGYAPQSEYEQRSCEGSELPTLERYGIRWNGPTAPIAIPMPDGYWTPWHLATAALEQRTSERRLIAVEVCELCGNAECPCHDSSAIADDVVERAARAICVENGWNPDEPVTYSGTRRKVKNRDGSRVEQWMLHTANARAALKSALPRGLPAGSDAHVVDVVCPGWLSALSEAYHILKGGIHAFSASKLYELHTFLATTPVKVATAEQPSCGQDARDAWQPIETAPKDGRTLLLGRFNEFGKWRTMRGQWMSDDYIAEHWEDPEGVEAGWFEDAVEAEDIPNCWPIEPTHWMPLPKAPAAIAAQQRQGGA